jgi:hypothetical protein
MWPWSRVHVIVEFKDGGVGGYERRYALALFDAFRVWLTARLDRLAARFTAWADERERRGR